MAKPVSNCCDGYLLSKKLNWSKEIHLWLILILHLTIKYANAQPSSHLVINCQNVSHASTEGIYETIRFVEYPSLRGCRTQHCKLIPDAYFERFYNERRYNDYNAVYYVSDLPEETLELEFDGSTIHFRLTEESLSGYELPRIVSADGGFTIHCESTPIVVIPDKTTIISGETTTQVAVEKDKQTSVVIIIVITVLFLVVAAVVALILVYYFLRKVKKNNRRKRNLNSKYGAPEFGSDSNDYAETGLKSGTVYKPIADNDRVHFAQSRSASIEALTLQINPMSQYNSNETSSPLYTNLASPVHDLKPKPLCYNNAIIEEPQKDGNQLPKMTGTLSALYTDPQDICSTRAPLLTPTYNGDNLYDYTYATPSKVKNRGDDTVASDITPRESRPVIESNKDTAQSIWPKEIIKNKNPTLLPKPNIKNKPVAKNNPKHTTCTASAAPKNIDNPPVSELISRINQDKSRQTVDTHNSGLKSSSPATPPKPKATNNKYPSEVTGATALSGNAVEQLKPNSQVHVTDNEKSENDSKIISRQPKKALLPPKTPFKPKAIHGKLSKNS